MRVLVTSLLLFTLLFLVTTNTTKKTLVLLDSFDIKNSHSQFFNSLKERGHDLEFRLASDSSNKLSQFGDYLYDNLIIMAPSTEGKYFYNYFFLNDNENLEVKLEVARFKNLLILNHIML